MDLIHFDPKTGQVMGAQGSVASMLINSGMNPEVLRTNATLLYDEWKLIDDAVIQTAKERLIGIADLRARGLVYPIANGLGTTVFQYQKQSDMSDAVISMDAVTRTEADRVVFSDAYLPLPIIHKEFYLTIRALEASRRKGETLDVTYAAASTRVVAEKLENMLFNGASSFAYGGGTLYGYTDHPDRVTGSISNWSDLGDSSAISTGEKIVGEILDAIVLANAEHYYGPFVLYIPTAYSAILDNDYKANSDRTIRERLLAIPAIEDVRVADKLAAGNVLLVQMTSDVVQLIDALALMPVEWDSQGGLVKQFRVLTIQIPWIKSDYNGNCGVIHLT